MARRRNIAGTGRLAAVLIATALFVRLLVPSGWMPSGAGFWLVLCPDGGPVPAVAAAPHGHGGMHAHAAPASDHDPASHLDQPCAFAGFSLPFEGRASVGLAQPPSLAKARTPRLPRDLPAVGRGLAAPPPPATGPPVLA